MPPEPLFPCYYVPAAGQRLLVTSHDGGYHGVLPDGRSVLIPCATPAQATAAADLAAYLAAHPLAFAAVPTKVGSGQIRAALIASGLAADDAALDTLVEGALTNALADATRRAIALTLWRNASEFHRAHAFIATAQAALGQSPDQIDDLFRLAATF